MSKATIVKGNKVVATADSVKEAQAYAKKVGGKVLVPASNPPARKNGSAQWTRAQVVDQIRKNIAAMSDSIEPDYTGIADLRRLAKLVAANDSSITWDRTHWRNGLDGVKLIEDGNAIYALRGYPAGGARKNGAETLSGAKIVKFEHRGRGTHGWRIEVEGKPLRFRGHSNSFATRTEATDFLKAIRADKKLAAAYL